MIGMNDSAAEDLVATLRDISDSLKKLVDEVRKIANKPIVT